MRIAVLGVGGVGGYFGARLAEAGRDVAFVARGRQLEALASTGLRVESPAGDLQLPRVATAAEPASCGLVLLGVKAWQVPEAAPAAAALLRPDGVVLTLQNGVEAADQLAAVVDPDRVVAGLCRIVVFVAEPGVIRHAGVEPRIEIGRLERPPGPGVERVLEAFAGAVGVSVGVADDIRRALWEKFLFIAPVSGVGAVSRQPVGAWRSVPETRSLLLAAMEEVAALARARGVALAEGCVARTLAYVDGLPADATASMQRDVADGRPSELESQVGAVVRLGREAGVPVPANAFLYAALRPADLRARGAGPA
jgi:2-dehydropantoate 2-reductase